ncbi:MAG TPA: hypothetical protein VK894_10365 [Jiangellales bacterium]|nr:hypothetical protein [Jiangellales bacterium]
MATANVQWTQQAYQQRQAIAQASVAPADQYEFSQALTSAIRAWALMTLMARQPGPTAQGQGQVSYPSTTAPTPKSLGVGWACSVVSWSPTAVTVQVTALS